MILICIPHLLIHPIFLTSPHPAYLHALDRSHRSPCPYFTFPKLLSSPTSLTYLHSRGRKRKRSLTTDHLDGPWLLPRRPAEPQAKQPCPLLTGPQLSARPLAGRKDGRMDRSVRPSASTSFSFTAVPTLAVAIGREREGGNTFCNRHSTELAGNGAGTGGGHKKRSG